MSAFSGSPADAIKGVAAAVTLLAALALPCTAVASASGQGAAGQQGDQVNPGSPAGQEYVIPIPAARSEAAGGSTSGAGGGSGGVGGVSGSAAGGSGAASGGPPLFGIGVTPSSGRAVANQAANHSSTKARAGGHDRRAKTGSTATAAVAGGDRPVSLASVTRPGSGSADGWLALVGGGLLVLVVGGGAGLIMRRRLNGS